MDIVNSIEDVTDPMAIDPGSTQDASATKQSRGLDNMWDDVEKEEANADLEALPEASVKEEESDSLSASANSDPSEPEVPERTSQSVNHRGEDLFGEQAIRRGESKLRQLDDEELDSGDDEDRNDRTVGREGDADDEDGEIGDNRIVHGREVGRAPVPETTSREVFLLKFPYFLRADPVIFTPETFRMPEKSMNTDPKLPTSLSHFSAATNTLRWRRSPQDPTKYESDSRILVWSDGSMTLQIANNPGAHFPLRAKAMVPPNVYSQLVAERSQKAHPASDDQYDPRLDAHTYLGCAHEIAGFVRLTHHVTTALTALPSSDLNHQALTRLQTSLVAAKRVHKQTNAEGRVNLMELKEDPELAQRRAATADKERSRQQKKLAASILRDNERVNRTMAKGGLRSGGGLSGGGLSMGGLEGGLGDMTSPRKAKGKRPGAGRRGGRGRLSDSDEDMPRGRTREDEYDRTDDFIVDTDEEEEGMEGDGDDDEDEEILDDASEGEGAPGKEGKSSKRKRPERKSGAKADKPDSGSREKRMRLSEENGDDA
ncbi:MAG: hypothetical protein M1816_005032 [Peltula sp. TS41687]|nr:MAG: hypothetical protein M1816_005032 [Peltula sp. TS41687]